MSAQKTPAIEVRDLVKTFQKEQGWRSLVHRSGETTTVLDHINLVIPQGEIFGLLGPNGAGKTTLIKVLSTLVTPTTGDVRVEGYDVVADERRVRRRIGLVYGDERSFYWRLSLPENLRFYGALFHIRQPELDRRIDELMKMVNLSHAASVRMHHFSSGMKQRAAIARGLLSDPAILYLDEPTKALDPVSASEIRRLVLERISRDDSRTVLLATNLMAEAEQLCDRIGLLHQGRLAHVGPVQDLRTNFQADDRYRIVVTALPTPEWAGLSDICGIHSVHFTSLPGEAVEVEVTVNRGDIAIPLLIRHLVEEGANVWSCEKDELSLESMFIMAYGQGMISSIGGQRELQEVGA